MLSLKGEWIECTGTRPEQRGYRSKSPWSIPGCQARRILAADGGAIGLVSTGDLNPVLVECIPAHLLRKMPRNG